MGADAEAGATVLKTGAVYSRSIKKAALVAGEATLVEAGLVGIENDLSLSRRLLSGKG